MSRRHHARAVVALAAAYAVALQTILLAFGAAAGDAAYPAGGPICAALHRTDPATTPGVPHDCLAACLTGTCSGVAGLPPPAALLRAAQPAAPTTTARVAGDDVALARMTGSHRSRAPPQA